jgi:hypothetical protein
MYDASWSKDNRSQEDGGTLRLRVWRVTGTFFQKTISAGQIISALLIRLRISFTKQFLIGLGVAVPGKLRLG